MNKNFRVVFSLRGDYKDSEGKSPIQTRIYIGSDRLRLGGTGFFVDEAKWDNKKYRGIGRTADILQLNNQLDHIETDLKAIFRRLEFSEELSLDRIKSEYLGDRKDDKFLLPFYDEFIETRRKEVGLTRSATSIQKYTVVKKRFQEFLAFKCKRKDIKFCELRYEIISGFEHYLLTEAKCQNNTVMRMLRTIWTGFSRSGAALFFSTNRWIIQYTMDFFVLKGYFGVRSWSNMNEHQRTAFALSASVFFRILTTCMNVSVYVCWSPFCLEKDCFTAY